ncbi:MAG: hypothetical protein J1F18_13500 [Lachnospiraceae bacterium]|nr:hypothetical protein [Lachnospiraceae bacterium]
MTEHEYEEWFEENLSEIESLDKADISNSPFAYVPRPLRRKRWLIFGIIGLVISLGTSFGLSLLYETADFWIWNWLSNAFLSLAFGLIASLIILSYTNLRDKNVAFYSDIIPKMEKRIDKMHDAYRAYAFKLDREYRKKDYKSCYEAWHIHSNTCFVIIGYLRFLNTVLSSELKSALPSEDDLQKADDRLLAANQKIQQEFFSQETICEETANECVQATEYGMYALSCLEQLLITIKNSLYGLKYNKNRNKTLKEDEI